jgi:thiamine kinase-like enzyme
MTPSQTPAPVEMQVWCALAPVLQSHTVTIKPLAGGLTNRNYRVDVDEESYVLRVAGEGTGLLGIDRASEAVAARAAAAAGVGPEVVAYLPEYTVLVTRFVHGRQLTAEDMHRPDVLARVSQALRRLHDHPAPEGLRPFSPFPAVRSYYRQARDQAVPLPAAMGRALELLDRIEKELSTGAASCLCHNDLLPANFLEESGAVCVIDWEYAGLGDRFFDLGNFAANTVLGETEERQLLEGYGGEARPEQLRRLRLMRLASDLRESTWSYLQAKASQVESSSFYLERGRSCLERFLAAFTTGGLATS